jgi:hypothetical protein
MADISFGAKAADAFSANLKRRRLGHAILAQAALGSGALGGAPAMAQEQRHAGAAVTAQTVRGEHSLVSIDIAEFRNARPNAVVAGYWRPHDGGGGEFSWDPDSTDDDDGLLTFLPRQFEGGKPPPGRWKRNLDRSHITFEMGGAHGDGNTDDFWAMQRVIVALSKHFGQGTVQLLPGKRYLCDYKPDGRLIDNLRLPWPNGGALVLRAHCVIEGPGGALGMTFRGRADLAGAAQIVLHPQMTVLLTAFAELRDVQIVRKTMGAETDRFSSAGPADIHDMHAQTRLWASEDGTRPDINGGCRSVAITNQGHDTRVNRVLVMGFHTAYFSDGYGRPSIEQLYFDTAGRGIEITRSGDDALVRRCYSNAFWSSSIAGQASEHGDFAARPGVAFDFHDRCDGLRCDDCSAIGWATQFRLSNVWSVTLFNPNGEPARQPADRMTRGILTENSVSHCVVINPLIDGNTYKLDFQHAPVAHVHPTGPGGKPGGGQYGTASITVIGGSLQGNPNDPRGHRAIRLGPYSSGVVIGVNLAGFPELPAIAAEPDVGVWKFIGLLPSLGIHQPMFEFASPRDGSKVLAFGCDPIDQSRPPAWTVDGMVVLANLPKSPHGLPPGALWRDGEVVRIV